MSRIALAPFLRSCPAVITLGIRPDIADYSPRELDLLLHAERVFYPTPRYLHLFEATGIPTFPSVASYRIQRSHLLQRMLATYLDLPLARWRIYFGARQKAHIDHDFTLPVRAMGLRPDVDPPQLLRSRPDLQRYAASRNPVLIEEGRPWTERVRILCVAGRCIGALWQPLGPEPAAEAPLAAGDATYRELAARTEPMLTVARIDDVVVEWCRSPKGWLIGGMHRPPLRWPAPGGQIERHAYVCELIESGEL